MRSAKVSIHPGQVWRSRDGGFLIILGKKASGMKHWNAKRANGRSHKIHEGTLQKYYELVEFR